MNTKHVQLKSGDEWVDRTMTGDELLGWFEEHSKDGVVEEDIKLFADVSVKADGDTYEWTMSDMSLDRDAERMDPDGADMKNFKRNPVVLWAHDVHTPAIGRVLSPSVRDGRVRGKIEFDTRENDPFAYMIGQKVKAGIISTGSVGFKPMNIELVEDAKDPTRLIHRKWELMEFSICNVPANVNATISREAVVDESKEEGGEILDILKRLDILEGEILTKSNVPEHRTYVDVLFADLDKTSPGPSGAGSIDQLVADKSSPPIETSLPTENATITIERLTGG